MAEAPPRPAPVRVGDAELLELAVDVAGRAAAVLLDHRRRMDEGADLAVGTKTSETDPVSIADADSEQALVSAISAARPDDGLLGEEGARRGGTTGLRWVVDPLDGTVNYLYGHRGWAVSVAVERWVQDGAEGSWVGHVGVVLDPVAEEVFSARTGEPATCNGRVITANDPVPLHMALVATGFAYDATHRAMQARTVARVLEGCRDIRRVGAAALDICTVASGRVDGYYEDSTQRWDWAAGAVIARSAGATVSPLVTVADLNGLVVAGPALHDPLRDLVMQEDPARDRRSRR